LARGAADGPPLGRSRSHASSLPSPWPGFKRAPAGQARPGPKKNLKHFLNSLKLSGNGRRKIRPSCLEKGDGKISVPPTQVGQIFWLGQVRSGIHATRPSARGRRRRAPSRGRVQCARDRDLGTGALGLPAGGPCRRPRGERRNFVNIQPRRIVGPGPHPSRLNVDAWVQCSFPCDRRCLTLSGTESEADLSMAASLGARSILVIFLAGIAAAAPQFSWALLATAARLRTRQVSYRTCSRSPRYGRRHGIDSRTTTRSSRT
jgi:hypothetical protein